jgi:hypothetical protein
MTLIASPRWRRRLLHVDEFVARALSAAVKVRMTQTPAHETTRRLIRKEKNRVTNKRTKKTAGAKRLLGTVGVESGQLLIIDPRNVSNPLLGDLATWASLISPGGAAELEVADDPGKFGTAVAFGRFGGDGFYNVYATYDGDAITSVTIDLENQLWRNGSPSEEEWEATQDGNREKVQELGEHRDAHMFVVECAQSRIKKGLSCVCGRHKDVEVATTTIQ